LPFSPLGLSPAVGTRSEGQYCEQLFPSMSTPLAPGAPSRPSRTGCHERYKTYSELSDLHGPWNPGCHDQKHLNQSAVSHRQKPKAPLSRRYRSVQPCGYALLDPAADATAPVFLSAVCLAVHEVQVGVRMPSAQNTSWWSCTAGHTENHLHKDLTMTAKSAQQTIQCLWLQVNHIAKTKRRPRTMGLTRWTFLNETANRFIWQLLGNKESQDIPSKPFSICSTFLPE
jgi:hypothetical protein